MAKYLRCHTQIGDTTVGKIYAVEYETAGVYTIRVDNGSQMSFTIQHDSDGKSFRNWFIITSGDDLLATKRTQLATLTAEIAELEAQLAEESRLKVGDYARVTDTTTVDDFALDDVVRITRYDGTAFPLRGECPVSGLHEWFKPASLTKITPAEARASLIAKIDAHFNEGGAESRE